MRFRYDRVFPGVGRIRCASGARTEEEHARKNAVLSELYANNQLEALRAIKLGRGLAAVLRPEDQLVLTAAQQFERLPRADATIATYQRSLQSLVRSGVVGPGTRLRDLLLVDWRALEQGWGRSPTHWNQCRRMLSRLLTLALGRTHPLRHAVLDKIPLRPDPGRTPSLTPADFRRVLAAMPETEGRPIYLVLVGLGLRLGEYLRLTREDLGPDTVVVRGGKTPASARVLPVEPMLRALLDLVVPCPWCIERIRRTWWRARTRAGVGRVTLHDLRHCHGQWSLDLGVADADVQRYLGHATSYMTRRYRLRAAQRRNAQAIAGVLFGATPVATPAGAPTGAAPAAQPCVTAGFSSGCAGAFESAASAIPPLGPGLTAG